MVFSFKKKGMICMIEGLILGVMLLNSGNAVESLEMNI